MNRATKDQEAVIALIESQQKELPEWSPARLTGEQLKSIAMMDPAAAELLAEDLRVKGKGIVDAEKQIKKRADEYEKKRKAQEKGSGAVCVQPWEAEDILRKFYGLPERTWGPDKDVPAPMAVPPASVAGAPGRPDKPGKSQGKIIDLTDFL